MVAGVWLELASSPMSTTGSGTQRHRARPATRAVTAVNRLTERWAAGHRGDGNTVFSAAGVWPLLALLADAADGPARQELTEAVGLPGGEAAGVAAELLGTLSQLPGVSAALGLWTRKSLPVRDEWTARLPAGSHGVLTGDATADGRALDTWAADRTGGLVPSMPVTLDDRTLLVLASALALRTAWFRPFEEWPRENETGPWAGRTVTTLHRTTALLDRVAVSETSAGPLTVAKVLGTNGLDVHLLLGEESRTPGEVLAAGVGVLSGRYAAVTADRLPYGEAGPGLTKRVVRVSAPTPPELALRTAAFALSADHDLLKRAGLFGLGTASEIRPHHFPGMSAMPLAIGSARQSSMAEFGALGFRAASVTAVAAVAGGMPERRHSAVRVSADFDRPFGFLAVHRTSRLVLTTGWVAEPTLADPDAYDL